MRYHSMKSNPALELTKKYTNRRKSLPDVSDMRRQNGPVKIIKPAANKQNKDA